MDDRFEEQKSAFERSINRFIGASIGVYVGYEQHKLAREAKEKQEKLRQEYAYQGAINAANH